MSGAVLIQTITLPRLDHETMFQESPKVDILMVKAVVEL